MFTATKLLFLVAALALLAVLMIRAYGSPARAYRHLRYNKGVAAGIVTVLAVFALALFLIPQKASADDYPGAWLAYSEIYLGIDYTKDLSPQCEPGGYDDNSTSNLGFRQNLYLSGETRFHFNLKYTHNSCAFNEDRNTYDALGLELIYRTDCVLLFFCM